MKQAVRPLFFLLFAAVLIGRSPASGAGAIAAIRVVPPVSSVKILPTGEVTAGRISDELSVVACRGEYEPASFVVTAAARIESLGVQVADRTGPGGTIPAGRIDVKVVKCWYQSSSAGEAADKELDKRALTPALLLNDDTLVKVDYEKKDNYLKAPLAGEEQYVWVSNPDEKEGDNPRIPSDGFPFKDSPTLLPVSLDANSNKQFWVTVHVPERAESGIYSGRITLSGQAEPVYLTLRLRVLPFELSKPYYTSSMYYNNQYGHQVLPRYRKEMEDLIAHGVSNPIFYPAGPEWDDQFLQIRKELGLAGQPLITIQNPGDPSPAELAKYIAWARSYGFTDVYFIGADEAHTEKLVGQLAGWQRAREAGARIFASGAQEAGSPETYGRSDSYFQTVGNLLDIFNNGRRPTREQAALWHSRGQKIWSYANPHVGQDDPEVYRRNYGLVLWRSNYDGIGIYAYQHHSGNSYNDFDGGMRELNLAYPTSDGVIDTIVWEGYREGVDDVRYVTTLERAIADAKAPGGEPRRQTAGAAEQFLASLDVESRNLDTVRDELIGWMLKLQEQAAK